MKLLQGGTERDKRHEKVVYINFIMQIKVRVTKFVSMSGQRRVLTKKVSVHPVREFSLNYRETETYDELFSKNVSLNVFQLRPKVSIFPQKCSL